MAHSQRTEHTLSTPPPAAELGSLWRSALQMAASSADLDIVALGPLGLKFRAALRCGSGQPRPGAVAALKLLDVLLRPALSSKCSNSRTNDGEAGVSEIEAGEATVRLVDAIGWELFDGLVVHLPVSLLPSANCDRALTRCIVLSLGLY